MAIWGVNRWVTPVYRRPRRGYLPCCHLPLGGSTDGTSRYSERLELRTTVWSEVRIYLFYMISPGLFKLFKHRNACFAHKIDHKPKVINRIIHSDWLPIPRFCAKISGFTYKFKSCFNLISTSIYIARPCFSCLLLRIIIYPIQLIYSMRKYKLMWPTDSC